MSVLFGREFQGGLFLEILSCVGRDPLRAWKASGSVERAYDDFAKAYVVSINGVGTLSLPKDDRKETLGLVQPYLVLQVFLPIGTNWSINLSISDSSNTRRRIILSTASRDLVMNPLHARVPIGMVKRGIWLNLCINVESIVREVFKGVTFRALDSIVIGSTVRVRRIFTLRHPPPDTSNDIATIGLSGNEDTNVENIPRGLDFSNGIDFVNQIVNIGKVLLVSANVNGPSRSQSAPSSSAVQTPQLRNNTPATPATPHMPSSANNINMRAASASASHLKGNQSNNINIYNNNNPGNNYNNNGGAGGAAANPIVSPRKQISARALRDQPPPRPGAGPQSMQQQQQQQQSSSQQQSRRDTSSQQRRSGLGSARSSGVESHTPSGLSQDEDLFASYPPLPAKGSTLFGPGSPSAHPPADRDHPHNGINKLPHVVHRHTNNGPSGNGINAAGQAGAYTPVSNLGNMVSTGTGPGAANGVGVGGSNNNGGINNGNGNGGSSGSNGNGAGSANGVKSPTIAKSKYVARGVGASPSASPRPSGADAHLDSDAPHHSVRHPSPPSHHSAPIPPHQPSPHHPSPHHHNFHPQGHAHGHGQQQLQSLNHHSPQNSGRQQPLMLQGSHIAPPPGWNPSQSNEFPIHEESVDLDELPQNRHSDSFDVSDAGNIMDTMNQTQNEDDIEDNLPHNDSIMNDTGQLLLFDHNATTRAVMDDNHASIAAGASHDRLGGTGSYIGAQSMMDHQQLQTHAALDSRNALNAEYDSMNFEQSANHGGGSASAKRGGNASSFAKSSGSVGSGRKTQQQHGLGDTVRYYDSLDDYDMYAESLHASNSSNPNPNSNPQHQQQQQQQAGGGGGGASSRYLGGSMDAWDSRNRETHQPHHSHANHQHQHQHQHQHAEGSYDQFPPDHSSQSLMSTGKLMLPLNGDTSSFNDSLELTKKEKELAQGVAAAVASDGSFGSQSGVNSHRNALPEVKTTRRPFTPPLVQINRGGANNSSSNGSSGSAGNHVAAAAAGTSQHVARAPGHHPDPASGNIHHHHSHQHHASHNPHDSGSGSSFSPSSTTSSLSPLAKTRMPREMLNPVNQPGSSGGTFPLAGHSATEEELELIYDPVLSLFYDAASGRYFEYKQ